jgi:flagellar FliJ protein
MSSDLRTLIRLHKWQLDEKRKALTELQPQADRLAEQAKRLEEEIVQEQDVARGSVEVSYSYAFFAKVAIDRRRRLAQSIAQVEAQIAVATEEMAEAFQELKRYELAQESRDRRKAEEVRHRGNAMLDEVALSGFVRRQRET